MTQKISFLKSTLLYSIGVFGSKVVLFILIPFYSFFLNKEELGQYDLVLISVTLLTPVITIQLADAVYRFLLLEKDKDPRTNIISSALRIVLLGYVVFCIVAFVLNFFLNFKYFYEFILLQLSSCLFFFFQQVTRGIENNRLYAIMGVVNSILIIGLSYLFVVFFNLKVGGILIALLIAQTVSVTFVVVFGKIYEFIKPQVYLGSLAKKLLRYSWPLLPNSISWWLIDLGNRYIILFFLSEEFNGIYAIAARYAGIIALFNSIFLLTWQDYAISDTDSEEDRLGKASTVFNRFMAFELSAIIVLSSAASYIIQWTTGSEFHNASNYLPILLLSAGISSFCAYYGALYLKAKNTLRVFTTTFIGGLVNITVSIFLINSIGLYAVSIGSVLGFTTTFLIRSRQFKLSINYKVFFLSLVFYVIVLFVQYYDYNPLTIVFIILSLVLAYTLNKDAFLSLITKVLKR